MPAARNKKDVEPMDIPGAFVVDCSPKESAEPGALAFVTKELAARWAAARAQGGQCFAASGESGRLWMHEKKTASIQTYIRQGFLPEEIAFTTQLTGLTQQDLTEKLGLSTRTLQRKVKENKRLSPEKSDRLFRLQRLTGAALELFEGDVAAMQRWLKTPLPVLDGESPVAYSDTEPGAQFVLDLIDRLEHGVFS
jgi:putative toxin-antitoxin system antitoxin component (TIGR02293 family)